MIIFSKIQPTKKTVEILASKQKTPRQSNLDDQTKLRLYDDCQNAIYFIEHDLVVKQNKYGQISLHKVINITKDKLVDSLQFKQQSLLIFRLDQNNLIIFVKNQRTFKIMRFIISSQKFELQEVIKMQFHLVYIICHYKTHLLLNFTPKNLVLDFSCFNIQPKFITATQVQIDAVKDKHTYYLQCQPYSDVLNYCCFVDRLTQKIKWKLQKNPINFVHGCESFHNKIIIYVQSPIQANSVNNIGIIYRYNHKCIYNYSAAFSQLIGDDTKGNLLFQNLPKQIHKINIFSKKKIIIKLPKQLKQYNIHIIKDRSESVQLESKDQTKLYFLQLDLLFAKGKKIICENEVELNGSLFSCWKIINQQNTFFVSNNTKQQLIPYPDSQSIKIYNYSSGFEDNMQSSVKVESQICNILLGEDDTFIIKTIKNIYQGYISYNKVNFTVISSCKPQKFDQLFEIQNYYLAINTQFNWIELKLFLKTQQNFIKNFKIKLQFRSCYKIYHQNYEQFYILSVNQLGFQIHTFNYQQPPQIIYSSSVLFSPKCCLDQSQLGVIKNGLLHIAFVLNNNPMNILYTIYLPTNTIIIKRLLENRISLL